MYDTPRPAPTARASRPRTTPSAAGWIALFDLGRSRDHRVPRLRRRRRRVLADDRGATAGQRPGQDHVLPAVDRLRPHGQDRAGPVRRGAADRRPVQGHPADRHRRPDGGRGQDVLGQRRLRSAARSSPPASTALRGNSRGASTITQQLVRQRLLDPALVQDPHRTFERKIKEIIQSIRLTEAYPGEAGKQQIIADYLNQNYYGNQAYGVKAAAQGLLRRRRPVQAHPGPGGDPRRRCRSRRRTTTS